jgi:hypothetical protein
VLIRPKTLPMPPKAPAEEMTRGDLKTSRTGRRTPFQVLADYY